MLPGGYNGIVSVPGGTVENGGAINSGTVTRRPPGQGIPVARPTFVPGALAMRSGVALPKGVELPGTPTHLASKVTHCVRGSSHRPRPLTRAHCFLARGRGTKNRPDRWRCCHREDSLYQSPGILAAAFGRAAAVAHAHGVPPWADTFPRPGSRSRQPAVISGPPRIRRHPRHAPRREFQYAACVRLWWIRDASWRRDGRKSRRRARIRGYWRPGRNGRLLEGDRKQPGQRDVLRRSRRRQCRRCHGWRRRWWRPSLIAVFSQ